MSNNPGITLLYKMNNMFEKGLDFFEEIYMKQFFIPQKIQVEEFFPRI